MVKCSFCGAESSQYTGLHLLKNDGTVAYFCSSKCRKNKLKLKRDKKRVKWTEASRIEAKVESASAEHKINAEKTAKVAEAKSEKERAEKRERKANK